CDVQSSSENQPFQYVTEQVPEEIAPNQQIVITSHKNIVNVHRDNVLDGGFRAFGRKSFDMWHELDAIKELPIFSGPDNAKMLVLDYKCNNHFLMAMLAYFIIHRGPGPNFIIHELYMALSEGIASIQPTPNEICDYELRGQVEAIAAASSEEEFKASFVTAVELINLAGCMSLTLHFNQDGQTTLVKSLTKFVVCDRIQSPFEQCENGLQTMGLVDEKKKNQKQWKEVFIFTIKPLDALQLDNINRKRIEERILVYWRDFLQDLEELFVTLKDLLAFTTGADEVPALGFNFPLQLSFIHLEDLQ
ncbi:hypothetical protein ACJMK2_043876, partial [Sinanodonta woodiana]